MKKFIFLKLKTLIIPYLYIGVILISGCNFSDEARELSGNYFYNNEGNGKKEIISHDSSGHNIYSEIRGYNYNSDFIIAAQRPIYEEYKIAIGFELRNDLKRYPTNSNKERIQSEHTADSILKNDPFYKKIFAGNLNYWIISHKEKELFGPLSSEEYKNKRKQLRIPKGFDIKMINK